MPPRWEGGLHAGTRGRAALRSRPGAGQTSAEPRGGADGGADGGRQLPPPRAARPPGRRSRKSAASARGPGSAGRDFRLPRPRGRARTPPGALSAAPLASGDRSTSPRRRPGGARDVTTARQHGPSLPGSLPRAEAANVRRGGASGPARAARPGRGLSPRVAGAAAWGSPRRGPLPQAADTRRCCELGLWAEKRGTSKQSKDRTVILRVPASARLTPPSVSPSVARRLGGRRGQGPCGRLPFRGQRGCKRRGRRRAKACCLVASQSRAINIAEEARRKRL
ncbi:mucin-19-like [Hippopotamus amphibius kiboko]|uniref:mucin-19-like n=1 Tax=Hippopotamus amphibius kiboko TaxID=575201 RepID=UPI0025991F4E|nr:mucin-19-like [Hippopotamus amphibius kiboko]